jgi:hypothetical protein
MKQKAPSPRLVVCVKNRGFAASLELRKVYRAISDPAAESHRLLRVVDESGESYLFPESYFVTLDPDHNVSRRPSASSKA